MPAVLIDTDIAIDYLRGDLAARPLVNRLWQGGQAMMSVLSVYELTAGMRDKEKTPTRNFIDACTLIEVTQEISLKGGELYRKYRAKGITLAPIDCLIAATALVKGYKVATRNVKHYPEKAIILDVQGL
ncbi:MAG: type II toxin-antitoxin system VapC family toxin [Desulfuromonadaceae bacterium]